MESWLQPSWIPPNPVSPHDGEKELESAWVENQYSFNYESVYKKYVSYLRNNNKIKEFKYLKHGG